MCPGGERPGRSATTALHRSPGMHFWLRLGSRGACLHAPAAGMSAAAFVWEVMLQRNLCGPHLSCSRVSAPSVSLGDLPLLRFVCAINSAGPGGGCSLRMLPSNVKVVDLSQCLDAVSSCTARCAPGARKWVDIQVAIGG